MPNSRSLLAATASALLTFHVSLAPANGAPRVATPPESEGAKAAASYQQAAAWWMANANGKTPVLSQHEVELLSDGLEGSPTPELRAAIAKARPYIDLVRAGGRAAAYGLELDRSQGFELLLPHLAPLRQAARVLRLDAEVRMADGDVAGAVESLISISGFAKHVRQDNILVSSLVAGAIAKLNDDAMERALSLGTVDQELAGSLADSIEAMRGLDPLHVADALRGETEMLRPSLEKAAKGELDLAALIDANPSELDASELTPEKLQEHFAKLESVNSQAIAAIRNPNREEARAAIAELTSKVESGEFGVLAKLLAPSYGRAAEATWRAEDMIAARWTLLDDIRHGRVSASVRANAAHAYVQIAELVESLGRADQEMLEAARLAGASLDEAAVRRAKQRLDLLRPRLRELFATAARCVRCDFDVARQPRPSLVPEYLPGLRGGVRILMADAVLGRADARDKAKAEKKEGADGGSASPAAPSPAGSADGPAQEGALGQADNGQQPERPTTDAEAIATALRAVGHLGKDPAVGHSVFAANILREAAAALDESVTERRVSADEAAMLLTIAGSLRAGDPLQLQPAIEKDRAELARVLALGTQADPQHVVESLQARGDAITSMLLTRQLSVLLNRWDMEESAASTRQLSLGRWTDEPSQTAPLTGIKDIVASEAIASTLKLTAEIRKRAMAAGEGDHEVWLSFVSRHSWTDIVGLAEVRSGAAGALHRMDDLLRPLAAQAGTVAASDASADSKESATSAARPRDNPTSH